MENPDSHQTSFTETPADENLTYKQRLKYWLPVVLKWIGYIAAGFVVLSFLLVLSLRWINPPTSSFMIQRQIEAGWNNEKNFHLHYQWVDKDQISPYIKIAAIASEDQRFAEHWGIDFKQIEKAIKESREGGDLRGASTITQQTAKNLFLWPGHNFIRKGIEAYLAVMMELLWNKQRILEVYLNIAEFGDGIYGVKAAARHFYGEKPSQLTMNQSALMVTAFPDPRHYSIAHPSGYMIRRRNWVLQYMFYLGGKSYLKKLQ